MRRAVIGLLLGGLFASSAHASYDSALMTGGRPLELTCFSEDQYWRDRCVDHIQALLDRYHDDTSSGRESALVACYLGELLTLRTVGLRSYREILEGIEWLDTADGRARTASYPETARIAREFADRIEPSRDAIQRLRDTGWLHWSCYASPFIWRRLFE